MSFGGVSDMQVREWAMAHDVDSLRLIRQHKDTLLGRARGATPCESDDSVFTAGLALARLFETLGPDAEVVAALEGLAIIRTGSDLGHVQLALARAHFEVGQLEETTRLLEAAAANPSAEVALSASFALVRLLVLSSRHDEARRSLNEARALYESTEQEWPWVDALLYTMESGLCMVEGRKRDALFFAESALSSALSYKGTESSLMAGLLGNIEFDLGHIESAERSFAMAVRLSKKAEAPSVEAIFVGYRGWALHHLGHDVRSRTAFNRAVSIAQELGLARFESQFAALRSLVGLTVGNFETRELTFRQAIADLLATGDRERADGLSVLQIAFDLMRARRADEVGGSRSRELFDRLVTAHTRLELAHESSDDARLAKRWAQLAFDDALIELGDRVGEVAGGGELVVAPAGVAGVGPSGRFSLERHVALSRLLWAFCRAWSEDRALGDDELSECAWPNERLTPDSRTHRLRVAVSSLRKQVLGAMLVRVEGAYRLEATTLSMIPTSHLGLEADK